ncbi:MAG: DinB family protein [Fimbriimonadaceae bacterium]
MNSEGALALRAWQAIPMDSLLSLLEESTRLWRNEIGEIGESAILWRPFPKGHSIGGIMLHMADEESLCVEEVIGQGQRTAETRELLKSDFSPHKGPIWPDPEPWPLYRYYEIQNWVRANTVRTLQNIADTSAPVSHPHLGEIPIGMLVLKLIQHESFHVGEIALHKLHFSLPKP